MKPIKLETSTIDGEGNETKANRTETSEQGPILLYSLSFRQEIERMKERKKAVEVCLHLRIVDSVCIFHVFCRHMSISIGKARGKKRWEYVRGRTENKEAKDKQATEQ